MKVVDVRYDRFWNICKELLELVQKITIVRFARVFNIDISDTFNTRKMLQLIGDMNDEFIRRISKYIWTIYL